MTPEQAREQLTRERDDVLRTLAGLERSFADIVAAAETANGDDEHDVEGETVAVSRAQVDALTLASRRQLAAVDAALARVDDGSYGSCLGCGAAILPARLEARPATPWCLTCAATRGP